MATTPQIQYEHSVGVTLDFDTNNMELTFMLTGKEFIPRTKAAGTAAKANDGVTVDPNNGYRVITCTSLLTAANVITLTGWLLPASSPTYGTYPRLTKVKFDGGGTNEYTNMKCVIVGRPKVVSAGDNRYWVTVTFQERTDT